MKYFNRIKTIFKNFPVPLNKENWKVIFLCLFGAAVFWLFNALNKNYTTRINQPVIYEYNTDTLIAISRLPNELPINVTGTGWQLLQRNLSIKTTPIRIPFLSPLETKYLTRPELLQFAEDQITDLTVNYIARDTLKVNIDRKVTKTMPLAIDSLVVLNNYIFASEVSIEPDTVVFTGPSSIMDLFQETLVLEIPPKDLNTNFDQRIKLETFISPLIKSNPESVKVKFELIDFVDAELEVRVEKINFPQDVELHLDIEKVNVTCRIPRNAKDDLNPYLFGVIVDFEYLDASDSTIIPEIIRTPDFARSAELQVQTIKISYEQP
ncbi:MAG: hypothetical protein ACFCUU_06795 [Cyclobacteriaceae bacterium]